MRENIIELNSNISKYGRGYVTFTGNPQRIQIQSKKLTVDLCFKDKVVYLEIISNTDNLSCEKDTRYFNNPPSNCQ